MAATDDPDDTRGTREPMDGFRRRRERSKEEIRRAAGELFNRFGVTRVSIADIARKAGVSQATIYNNFGSKNGLVGEYVMGIVDLVLDQARAALSRYGSYREKMLALPAFFAEMMANRDRIEGEAFQFPDEEELLLHDPEIQQLVSVVKEHMVELFMEMVRENEGEARRPEVSEDAYRFYFRFLIDTFADPELHPRFHREPDLVREIISLVVFGLSGEPRD